MCYVLQPIKVHSTFVKDYGFLSFAKNMTKNIGENISNNFSGKYSQKLFDHAKQSAAGVFKTASKRVIQKTVEATGDFVGNKLLIKSEKFQKTQLVDLVYCLISLLFFDIPLSYYYINLKLCR